MLRSDTALEPSALMRLGAPRLSARRWRSPQHVGGDHVQGLDCDRASASYLVWIGGQAKILVDAGGGAFLRFAQAEARYFDLSLIAISHLHPDHVSDLPALLWPAYDPRKGPPLAIAGPSGNDMAPDFLTFLSRLFDQNNGAFQVLGVRLRARRDVPVEIVSDATKREPSIVLSGQDVTVTSIGVPHGNLPALAYRVQAQNKTIVFSGDQNGSDPRFVEFARGADVVVMHLAIRGPESDDLHASPGVVGQVARDAHVGRLVLGHIGRSLNPLEPYIAEVRKYYVGPLIVGADLQCTPVP